jgi:hypothetical protein
MKPSQFNALLRQLPAAAATAATQRVAARRRTWYRAPLLPTEVATLERLGHADTMVYYPVTWDAANPFEVGTDATYIADGLEHDALLDELRAYPQTPSIARLLYVVSNAVAS